MSGAATLQFRGRAWVVGDNIPTDDMAEFFDREVEDVLAEHNPDFALGVQPGDVLVAGAHFGQSSGRALAVRALQATGVSCVVAESLARTFQRNAFEIGFPVLECQGVSGLVADGDRILVDIPAGLVEHEERRETVRTPPPDAFLLDMLRAGGLLPLVRARGERWLRAGSAS